MKGATGENLLTLLESRLDNVVYRLGMTESRPQARQMVTHKHITVNGEKVNIPSYIVPINLEEKISINKKKKKSKEVKNKEEKNE